VSAGWVAGSVRARALARRRVGMAKARRIAGCRDIGEALGVLSATAYLTAPIPAGDGLDMLAAAQHAIAESLLWDMRVLAGWLPQGGAPLMRAVAGWFEIANVTERLAGLEGGRAGPPFRLGALATAWPRLRHCDSRAAIRAALTASPWKDPGGDTAQDIGIGMRARWAQRVGTLGEPARTWAASALVLLLAADRFGENRPSGPVLRSACAELIGEHAAGAASLPELAGQLPSRLSWVLKPAEDTLTGLWRSEAAWWTRTEGNARDLLAGSGLDAKPVLGAVAVLAADARRVCAALEVAARGGGSVEVFDAVA
jgi:hypothetical protein